MATVTSARELLFERTVEFPHEPKRRLQRRLLINYTYKLLCAVCIGYTIGNLSVMVMR